ncbi:MAG TPA: acyltransferase [Candidatus Acidoferrum sp.]
MADLTSPSFSEFSRVRFFGSLDGLRALSILGVLWTHVWYVSGLEYYNRLQHYPVLKMGAFGVDVFFGISGFLITTLLLRERSKNGRISLRDFYLRRSLRIWPLYYATLGIYVLLVIFLQRGTGRDRVFFHFFPGYLTFTYTWFAGWAASGAVFNFAWSLSVEEQFYVVWALVLRILRGLLPTLVMILMIFLRLSVHFNVLQNFILKDSLPWRIAAGISVPICLGAILAQILHSEKGFRILRPILGSKWAAPLWLLLLLASLVPRQPFWQMIQWFLVAAVVGSCVIREDNALAPFLRFRPLAYIGLVSYGMYLLNTLVLDAVNPVMNRIGLRHPLLKFPVFVAVTVLVAGISYRFFETPFLRLKERFSKVRDVPPVSKVALAANS